MDFFEQTAYWLLAGSKGAANRLRIIQILDTKPMNLNELSKQSDLNYKTAQHHIELLMENNLVSKAGNRYGQVFFISEQLKTHDALVKKLLETKPSQEGA
jgi:predicted transcriptional regulator